MEIGGNVKSGRMKEPNVRGALSWKFLLRRARWLCRDERQYRFFSRAWGKICPLSFFLLALFLLLPQVWADPGEPAEEQSRPYKSYLASLEYGWPSQFLARQKYANFHQMTFILSREWEFGPLAIPQGHGFVESLLGELRLSKIWGKNIPLEPDEVSTENAEKARQEGRSPTTDWDHYQVAITPFYRVYYPLSTKTRPYGEIGAGYSWLNKPLVDNGTNWNFSLIAGLGIEREIYKIPFYVVLRGEHFSNGATLWSKFGFTKSNIGLETVVLGMGVRFH